MKQNTGCRGFERAEGIIKEHEEPLGAGGW